MRLRVDTCIRRTWPRLASTLHGFDQPLRDGRVRFDAQAWPDDLQFFRSQLVTASDAALRALDGVTQSATDPDGVMRAYRAMRHSTQAVEALYPLTFMLPPVSRFFLESDRRSDDALVRRIADADALRDDVGMLNVHNARDERGGFSVYVPEYYDAATRWPVIVALHGGSGHGADFLWTWLREARTRGAIVISPTLARRHVVADGSVGRRGAVAHPRVPGGGSLVDR